ncbi:MAG: hypothetical protein ACYC28_04985 [Longimicrobiales bacterium]
MILLIGFAPAGSGRTSKNEQAAPAALPSEPAALLAAARWWWLNWTRFAQGRLEK